MLPAAAGKAQDTACWQCFFSPSASVVSTAAAGRTSGYLFFLCKTDSPQQEAAVAAGGNFMVLCWFFAAGSRTWQSQPGICVFVCWLTRPGSTFSRWLSVPCCASPLQQNAGCSSLSQVLLDLLCWLSTSVPTQVIVTAESSRCSENQRDIQLSIGKGSHE